MISLSLCMITKNEALFLPRCLESVKGIVDEIIIVDTGSTDATKSIALSYGAKVVDYVWDNDFSKPRNKSLSLASKDWILVLDADEIISRKDLTQLKKALDGSQYDALYLIQRNYTNDSSRNNWQPVDGKYPEEKQYKGFVRNPIIRLFRNHQGIKYEGVVHEVVDTSVKNLKTAKLNVAIHHYYEEKELKKRQLHYLALAEAQLAKKPDGRLYASAGAVLLYFVHDYQKALNYFEKAYTLGYKPLQSRESIAEAYIKLKDYDNAYSIYKELTKKNYLTPTLCNNLANILAMHKHYKPALKFLRLALQMGNPNKDRIQKNIEWIEKKIA